MSNHCPEQYAPKEKMKQFGKTNVGQSSKNIDSEIKPPFEGNSSNRIQNATTKWI